MRSLIAVLVALVAGSLSVGACSSDGDDSSGSAGTGSTMCLGDYSALTETEFDAQLDSAGKCTGTSDRAIECSNDVTTLAEQCGADCYKTDAPDDKTQDACVKGCLSTSTSAPLSTACTDCYITDVGCARDHCLIPCGTAPTSERCYDCRVENGCVAAFFPCSGLPNEKDLSGAGGAADAAGGVGTSAGAGGANAEPSAGGAAGS